MVGFLAAFVPIYDHLISVRAHPATIADFLTKGDKLEEYLHKGTEIGTIRTAGRLDSIEVSAKFVAKDPVWLAFGMGIGNASESSLGQAFAGRYLIVMRPFLVTSFAHVVLELGFLGFLLMMAIYWLIATDANYLARRSAELPGAIGAGWVGVTLIMGVAVFYKTLLSLRPCRFPSGTSRAWSQRCE